MAYLKKIRAADAARGKTIRAADAARGRTIRAADAARGGTISAAAAICALVLHGAASAAPLFDLDPYSFREVGGVFEACGAAYCAATNMANSEVVSIRARIVAIRPETEETATLGIVAYQSPENYWQLALVKPHDKGKYAGKRNFELKAMVASVWGGEKEAARRIESKQKAQWEYGREYDFSLEVRPDRVEGTVTDAESGKVVFHAAYEPAEGAEPFVSARPALMTGGWLRGTIGAVSAETGDGSGTASAGGPAPLAFPAYRPSGPETGVRGTATGFFHVETIDGRDWPIDPAGRAVILAGAQHIKPWGVFSDAVGYSPYGRFVATNYPSVDAWADETLARLDDWGFTMLGNACALGVLAHKTLPHVRNIQLGQRVSRGDPDWFIREWAFKPCSALPNVFHPDFAAACEWRAREQCAPYKDDPWLIGWFIDNELAWWGTSKRIKDVGLYGLVSKLPPSHSARKVLDAFLAERGLEVGPGVPKEAKIEFLRLYARTYYEKTVAAIRKADPNHMVLGSRYAGLSGAPPVVWEEAGKLCDVVTFNCYPWADLDRGIVLDVEGGVPMTERLREYHGYAKAPLMITEWSFPALDHGHPCLVGAGQRLRTQDERVEATMLFAKTLLADPHVVGYDHFKFNDQPKTGSSRHAPEDCNYGLVNDNGVPYEGITQAFKALHSDLVHWRSAPPPAERVPATGAGAAGDGFESERDRYFAGEAPDVGTGASAATPSPAPGSAAPVVFRREPDGSYAFSNGLVSISGRIGSKWIADKVVFGDGKSVGRLGALLAAEDGERYLWLDTTRLAGVEPERDETTGAVSVLLRGLGGRAAAAADAQSDAPGNPSEAAPPETDAETTLAFAVAMRLTLLPGRPDALMEVAAVENLSDAPLAASAVYMRAFSRDKQTTRPTSAPNVWKAPKIGSWSVPGGGEWGLVSHDTSIRKFRFFVTPNGVQHPDAAFSPVLDGDTFEIAPGGVWQPAIPMGARLFRKF